MKKLTTKRTIGYIIFLLLVFVPGLALAYREEWITDGFGVLGFLFLLVCLIFLSGNLMNDTNN